MKETCPIAESILGMMQQLPHSLPGQISMLKFFNVNGSSAPIYDSIVVEVVLCPLAMCKLEIDQQIKET